MTVAKRIFYSPTMTRQRIQFCNRKCSSAPRALFQSQININEEDTLNIRQGVLPLAVSLHRTRSLTDQQRRRSPGGCDDAEEHPAWSLVSEEKELSLLLSMMMDTNNYFNDSIVTPRQRPPSNCNHCCPSIQAGMRAISSFFLGHTIK